MISFDAVELIVLALATFRISRLVVEDTIFDVPRAWLLSRWPGDDTEFARSVARVDEQGRLFVDGTTTELVAVEADLLVAANPRWFGRWLECIWCVSVWVAAAVVVVAYNWDSFEWVAVPLALSAAAGWFDSSTK